MAKNCRNSDADPVAKPRCRNRRGSSSGSSVRSSASTNATRKTTPPMSPTSVSGSVQPRSGPSMMPSTSSPMPTRGEHRAERVEADVLLGARARHDERSTPMQRERGERGGDDEDRAPRELLEQRARREDAEGAAGAGEAGPDADRLGPLLGREHAGDGRERAGHEQRGADAHERAQRDELVRRVRRTPTAPTASAEDGGAGDERAAAPEAVAERAGGEQQRGEGEGVGVDDPLLRRLAGVEVGGDARQGVGEHRDAGDDHHQRQAHHGEDPAPVGVLGRCGGRSDGRGGSAVTGAPRGAAGGSAVGGYTRQRRMVPPDTKRRYAPFASGPGGERRAE